MSPRSRTLILRPPNCGTARLTSDTATAPIEVLTARPSASTSPLAVARVGRAAVGVGHVTAANPSPAHDDGCARAKRQFVQARAEEAPEVRWRLHELDRAVTRKVVPSPNATPSSCNP